MIPIDCATSIFQRLAAPSPSRPGEVVNVAELFKGSVGI